MTGSRISAFPQVPSPPTTGDRSMKGPSLARVGRTLPAGPFLLSGALLLLVTAWMASGQLQDSAEPARKVATAREPRAAGPMKVLVDSLPAREVAVEVVVQGQIEPRRRLDLRAEVSGQVADIPARKGAGVQRGQVLLRLAADDRPARVAQARAELVRQRLDVEAARRLFERKLQSESRLRLAEASMAAARAALEAAELELERTEIRAPFDGVVETIHVELGAFVDRADPMIDLVDDTGLKAVGYVPQQSAPAVGVGQPVSVRLLDGRTLEGQVEFISKVADAKTRSFRIEADVAPGAAEPNAGVSAELRITVGMEQAHFASPSILALDDQGRVGVKAVDENHAVVFHPISLVRTQADGVWVSGLPEDARVIVQGQGFVTGGQIVAPVSRS